MNEEPLVSIIMPNYNCEKYLSETIKSVVNQTYNNWELIIVDDCSTDRSVTIIQQFMVQDSRIKLIINERNIGAALSRNKAIEVARGEYIAFLDSDDLWLENKLEKQINFMKNYNIDFSYSYYYVNHVNRQEMHIVKAPKYLDYRKLLKYNYIGCLTVVYKVKSVGKVQIIDLKKRNDYALWLKILKKTDGYLLPEPLAIYNKRDSSLSSNKFNLIKFHYLVFHKSEGFGVLLSLFYALRNVFYYLYFKLLKKK